jgi:pyruvate dehydrogenase E2 component (dihydrolipoamide acetyltransferase)
MEEKITIPKLGMTMKEAKIVAWKFKEGDWIEAGQVVLEIETEKLTYEVQTQVSGFLHILAQPETKLPVGVSAGLLAETKEELAKLQIEMQTGVVDELVTAGKRPAAEAVAIEPEPGKPGRIKISPLAKKWAEEHSLDYTILQGSGPDGRIVKEDVERALIVQVSAPSNTLAQTMAVDVLPNQMIDGKRVKTVIPLKGMRKAIANHMVRSLQAGAQLTAMTEFDATELVRLRKQLLDRETSVGFRVSYTDVLVYILVRALKATPVMNVSLIDDRIVLWDDINIGVAVATQISEYEGGLIVPVVRNADKKSLSEIHRDVASLVEKARSGKLLPDDVTGSTFTLTNTGTLSSLWSWGTPIINQPESAILQTGPIMERAAVVDGQVVVRSMMSASITFDHRVLDGAPVNIFMERLRDLFQNPATLIGCG